MMGVTPRTLERWSAEEPRPAGRPRHSEAEYRGALRPVRAALLALGRWTGAEAVFRYLRQSIPLRVVREAARRWKERWRRRRRERRKEQRVTVEVRCRDAAWSVDATHLGRLGGRRVVGVVVREVASGRTLALSVGGEPGGAELVALLERAYEARGVLPLVLLSDNGSENVNRLLRRWLRAHRVVHLRNLPRTPQHNAWSERGMRELKEASGIEGREVYGSLDEAAGRLAAGWWRVDREVPRRVSGWRTREVRYARMAPWYPRVDREDFFRTACAAVEQAVHGASTARGRRIAERGAIYATLERFELIRRTRGGAPLEGVKGDG